MKDSKALDDLMGWITPPEWSKDAVVVDVDIVFDWRDMVLLIWRRGRMSVSVKTWTELGPVGRVESQSRVVLQRILWPWKPKMLGVMDTSA